METISHIVFLLTKNMKGRFPSRDLGLAGAFSIYNPTALIEAPSNAEAALQYGAEQFGVLANFYGSKRGDFEALLDPVDLSSEWEAHKGTFVTAACRWVSQRQPSSKLSVRDFWKPHITQLQRLGCNALG